MKMGKKIMVSKIEVVGNRKGEKVGGVSGSTLKMIALVTMLIDHVAATVIIRMLLNSEYAISEEYNPLSIIYLSMRMIGRIAFPIYCFLMVEGFLRTHNQWRYAARIAVFALLSEIPFDLAFCSSLYTLEYQNVFFTLLFGLLALIFMSLLGNRSAGLDSQTQHLLGKRAFLRFAQVVVVIGFAIIAKVLNTDYGAFGVLAIVLLYVSSKKKSTQIMTGIILFLWEMTASFAFLPIAFYNGKRGIKIKYLFYVFYPLHLLILYMICMCMGIEKIPTM